MEQNKGEELKQITGEIMDKLPEQLDIVKVEGHPAPVRIYSIIDDERADVVVKKKHEMAKVLQDVVNKKLNGFEVNGQRILGYDEWLMIAKMHQCVPRVVNTEYTLQKYGSMSFEATAELVHVPTGNILGRAEAMCEQSEPGKGSQTLNKIKSMAQTRACSKVMRLAFSDIAILAGYNPTPLEEMDDSVKPVNQPKLKNLRISNT